MTFLDVLPSEVLGRLDRERLVIAGLLVVLVAELRLRTVGVRGTDLAEPDERALEVEDARERLVLLAELLRAVPPCLRLRLPASRGPPNTAKLSAATSSHIHFGLESFMIGPSATFLF